MSRTQAAEGAEKAVFVSGDLDFWPLILTFNLVQARDQTTKHVFLVNLAEIRSAVPEIFYTQTKNPQTDGAETEPSEVHCVR